MAPHYLGEQGSACGWNNYTDTYNICDSNIFARVDDSLDITADVIAPFWADIQSEDVKASSPGPAALEVARGPKEIHCWIERFEGMTNLLDIEKNYIVHPILVAVVAINTHRSLES